LIAAVLAVLVVPAGCSSEDAGEGRPSETSAPRLAPSQITADTVAPPPVPDPCDPDELAWWTAAVEADDAEPQSLTAVIRVENRGETWCEVDIAESPHFAPEVEPDVWLEPGGLASVAFGPDGTGCTGRRVEKVALVGLGGRMLEVPTLAAGECLGFSAFYPEISPTRPCDAGQLDATIVSDHGFVVVETGVSCRIGALTAVTVGDAARDPAELDEDASVDVLLVGDHVGYPFSTAQDCPLVPAVLTIAGTGDVPVELPACAVVRLGAARPYVGDDRIEILAADLDR
jgi:hypothetical protein